MLNIVDSIHNYLGESINGCLLGMLNIVDSIRTGNNKKALIKFARYVKYSGQYTKAFVRDAPNEFARYVKYSGQYTEKINAGLDVMFARYVKYSGQYTTRSE